MSDTNIIIATGTSRRARSWKSDSMRWSDLVEKLSTPVETKESAGQYRRMNKTQQGDVKDVGGFVGGYIPNNGRRIKGAVSERYLLTLDADSPSDSFLTDLDLILGGMEYVLYSTHSHTDKEPRYRVIVPTDRPMQPDEFEAVSRRIADDIGMDSFDASTHEAERLMYWPSKPSDVDYVFQHSTGALLSVDDQLATYKDWHDVSLWPTSSNFNEVRIHLAKKQGNPLEKPGLIGAFCKCYRISEAIEKFLNDVYEPCDLPGRYTYKLGSTTAGLVVYDDDTFAYSHHGTDPISGQLVNAFDLVRIHKFGDLDADSEAKDRPSMKAMYDFVIADGEASVLLDMERAKEFDEDFEDLQEADDKEWRKKLTRSSNGATKPQSTNCLLILKNDPNLKGKFGLDEFAHRLVCLGDLPWRKKDVSHFWTDSDDACLRNYFSKMYGLSGKGIIDDALQEVMNLNKFHPVRDYLTSTTWDEVQRAESLFIDYLGAEDSPYTRAVTRKWLVGAVARVMQPGVKFDTAIVLYGEQGLGKSLILERLGGAWFNNTVQDIKTKDALEQIQGSWIIELAELAPTYKNDNEVVKAFLSRTNDRFRAPYGRRTEEYPRQCVFAGSTNNLLFLKDRTGNRRFWPLTGNKAKRTKLAWTITAEEIAQIWAEAFYLWANGESLVLDEMLEQEAIKVQQSHTEGSEMTGLIEEYLQMLLPEDWASKNIYERREYIENYDPDDPKAYVIRDRVCALEIWCELLGGDRKSLQPARTREVIDILQSLDGWGPYQVGRGRMKFGKLYGLQKAFVPNSET